MTADTENIERRRAKTMVAVEDDIVGVGLDLDVDGDERGWSGFNAAASVEGCLGTGLELEQ